MTETQLKNKITLNKEDVKLIIELFNEQNKILTDKGFKTKEETDMLINRLKNKL